VNVPCTYSKIGEVDINLNQLVVNNGDTTPFSLHSDSAPTIYVKGQPAPADPSVRELERLIGGLTAVSPITGNTDQLTAALADPVEEKMLHMVTSDPARTPTFTMFGNPDYFFAFFGSATPTEEAGFAWNHGDIQSEIARTFIGIVGPGVRNLGVTSSFFSDHTDVRPTIMSLVGLNDDYGHDGRVLVETLDPALTPQALQAHQATLLRLGQVYKQLSAPFGQLAKSTLKISTIGIQSNSPNDFLYSEVEDLIAEWTDRRDSIAGQMRTMLENAEFHGQAINEQNARSLILQAQILIGEANFVSQIL
jgi:hypothetical protein